MTKFHLALGVALVAVIIAIGAYFYPVSQQPLGAATGPQHYGLEAFLQGLQIGSRGTEVRNLLKGTCSLIVTSYSVAASTTVNMDCAVTGVIAGDTIFGTFATSSASVGGPGWEITGAAASTTSGYISFSITNGTGGTALIPPAIASSTRYLDIR